MKKEIDIRPQELPNFVISKIDKSKINVDVLFENATCKEFLQVQKIERKQ